MYITIKQITSKKTYITSKKLKKLKKTGSYGKYIYMKNVM